MSDSQQLCEMFPSEDIQSIFILISILLVRLDGILACLSEEEKLSPFFKLEGFLTCLFTLTEWWPPKLTQCPCGWRGWWVEDFPDGGEGWPGGPSERCSAWQPVFGSCWDTGWSLGCRDPGCLGGTCWYLHSRVLCCPVRGPLVVSGAGGGSPWLCHTGGAELGVWLLLTRLSVSFPRSPPPTSASLLSAGPGVLWAAPPRLRCGESARLSAPRLVARFALWAPFQRPCFSSGV